MRRDPAKLRHDIEDALASAEALEPGHDQPLQRMVRSLLSHALIELNEHTPPERPQAIRIGNHALREWTRFAGHDSPSLPRASARH